MKNKDLLIVGGIVGVLLLFQKKQIGMNGVNDPQKWNIDRIKKRLGRELISYRELRDLSIQQVNKTDMAYSSGMHAVINAIFTDQEQFEGLATQFEK
jgi:hypothetical protein